MKSARKMARKTARKRARKTPKKKRPMATITRPRRAKRRTALIELEIIKSSKLKKT